MKQFFVKSNFWKEFNEFLNVYLEINISGSFRWF